MPVTVNKLIKTI